MKKIIFIILLILFIPFIIIINYKRNYKEIELKYINTIFIRVKRNLTDNIEIIPLEEYLVGVLAGEMPIDFEMEALKAQAVASRSYAIKRIEYNKDKDYDIVDSVMNQVYLDNDYLKKAWDNNYIKNINKLRTAINETIDEVLVYDNQVIDALFFSTSNGYTENSEYIFDISLPYLKSVESHWDEETSPAFFSKKQISLNDFYRQLNIPYSKNLNIEIKKRSVTGRILLLNINNIEFKGMDVYNKLALKSSDFSIELQGDYVVISTKGYGHGVGMSQYGAEGMAKNGFTYIEILKHYYSNTEIKNVYK